MVGGAGGGGGGGGLSYHRHMNNRDRDREGERNLITILRELGVANVIHQGQDQ